LRVDADRYLPATEDFHPTGEIVDVTGTPMDFRTARVIAVNDPPFDNNFCLSDTTMPLRDVLWLSGQSGVGMVVATDQPGMQVYDGRHACRPGRTTYEGLAVEAQGWPDAPSNPDFPSIRVTPDKPYQQVTAFRFHRES
jgi:aldose 1-epimerase